MKSRNLLRIVGAILIWLVIVLLTLAAAPFVGNLVGVFAAALVSGIAAGLLIGASICLVSFPVSISQTTVDGAIDLADLFFALFNGIIFGLLSGIILGIKTTPVAGLGHGVGIMIGTPIGAVLCYILREFGRGGN